MNMLPSRLAMHTLLSGAALMVSADALAAYKCVDEGGKAHYQDTPPSECANVVIYEVSSTGTIVRKIEPTTGARKADPATEHVDRGTTDRARRDRTLLDSFSSEQEIDSARDRNLELLNARLNSTQRNLEQVKKRRQQLDAMAAQRTNASGGALPPNLTAERERLRSEESSIADTLARERSEMERVSARFAEDKKRWKELMGSGARQ